MVLRFILALVFLFSLHTIYASELIACKSDTYISQTDKNKEFSKAKFLKISNKKDSKTIAYLPFYIDTNDIGYQAERDTVIQAVLSLRFKLHKEQSQLEADSTTKQKTEKIENKTSNIEEKIEHSEIEKKCQFHFYAITDAETFIPNSEESKVSWDGKNTSTAPKHNNIDDELADDGLLPLGELTIDFEKKPLEDGEEIEFFSDKLEEFLNFAFGSITTQKKHSSFRSQLEKIERICIIVKQTAGNIPLHIYSADSLDEEKSQQMNKQRDNSNKIKTSAENTVEDGLEEKEVPDFRPRIIFEFRGI